MTEWLAEQIRRATEVRDHSAESIVPLQGRKVRVRFDCLRHCGQTYAYAVQISDWLGSERFVEGLPEGATVVTRQEWHEIKNHLGGLKLYATFLRRKIAGDENQVVVEKLLKGINGLIDHLARIRRGE
ncbi:MAG TPA: hypothetical protein VJX67_14360 [Blastocatellia bacterium]|nr:hypothetical protein [Blastocatellia bacterium]